MPRITIRSRIVGVVLAAGLMAAGCSEKYEQGRLDEDSPQAGQVRRMISSARQAGIDRIGQTMRRQAAEGLDDRQAGGMRAALEEIVSAEQAKLVRMESFGSRVFRATLDLTDNGGQRKLFILLVESHGSLRWAGPN